MSLVGEAAMGSIDGLSMGLRLPSKNSRRAVCGQAANFMENKFALKGARGSCPHQFQRTRMGHEDFNEEIHGPRTEARFPEFL